ncbi:MAG: polyprenyl synthetase family protein [Bacillota bacterium]
MKFDTKNYLRQKQSLINEYLDIYMPKDNLYPIEICQAMRYSVFAGGKRLRPILTIASCEAVGGKELEAIKVACAIELIHTYSLIHDDLPAMDDDDFRRGKPTCHKVFGEGIAILAGDALLTYAFELLAEAPIPNNCLKQLEIIKEISVAAGYKGMIAGQNIDLISEKNHQAITPDILSYIHENKTGALFRAAIKSGALLGGANEQQLESLVLYARYFGLAFQIVDDILDVEGNSKIMGKSIGSDKKNQKATYPSLYGLEKSKTMASEAINKALDCLSGFGNKANALSAIAIYTLTRNN